MIALLLPGMTLNASVFPSLPCATIACDFNDLVLSPDGDTPELRRRRMLLYADLLDRRLAAEPAWRDGPRLVVAHSFGGMLALTWWLAHAGAGPARVDGMVLIATTAGPMFDRVRLRVPGTPFRVPLAPVLGLWNRPVVTRAAKRWLAGSAERVDAVDFRQLASPTDWAVDRAGWLGTDWRAMRSYRLALEGFDVRDRLAAVSLPIVVLHGTADSLLPPAVARDLVSGLPNARLTLIAGAGHALPLTHGDAVRGAVEQLLRDPSRHPG
jgi:pimeloyl-ACP methyl ester carboxylesterase